MTIIQRSLKYILNDPKSQKKRFLAIFWSLVCWIDLILHIVIVLNVFQLLAALPVCEGSFKSHKNAFLNDQTAKKEVFGHFLEFGLLDRLDNAYCDCTRWFKQFCYYMAHAGSFKSHKNAFLNDPKCPKGGFVPISRVWLLG